MENLQLPPEIQVILERYLAGGPLSPDESGKLTEWIGMSEENRDLFVDLSQMEFNVRGALEEPEARWGRLERQLKMRRLRVLKKVMKYAAVLVVGVVGAWSLLQLRGASQPQVFTCSAGSSPAVITLPDGSSVKLGSNSTLIYNDRFNVDNRDTRLIGEAFFVVEKGGKVPFNVAAGSNEIHVTGTMFNVNARVDTMFVATLVEGSIVYENRLTRNRATLSKGTVLRYNSLTHRINTSETSLTAEDFLENEHQFTSVPLKHILEKMGEIYGLKIMCDDPDALKRVYRASFFEGENEEEFLEIVSELCSLDYRYLSDTSVLLSARD